MVASKVRGFGFIIFENYLPIEKFFLPNGLDRDLQEFMRNYFESSEQRWKVRYERELSLAEFLSVKIFSIASFKFLLRKF